jgi:putative transposase
MSNKAPEQEPHAANLRIHRTRSRQGCWFITKCIEPRRSVLVSDVARKTADALAWYGRRGLVNVAAFVVMPDHWHLLMHTKDGGDVTEFMASACRWISRETRDSLQSNDVRWQDGFHETLVRTVKQFQFVRHYIEENPVKKGLAASPGEWLWSTANGGYRDVVPQEWPLFEEE